MSGNREETLRQFCDVTGADENRSKFFLESSNWQLEEAISSFYEHGGNVEEPPSTPAVPASMPIVMDSDSDMDSAPDSPQKVKKDKKKTNSNFATLSSLQQESSSDEEEGKHKFILPRLPLSRQSAYVSKHKISINSKISQKKFPFYIVSKFAWIRKKTETIVQDFFCNYACKNKTKNRNVQSSQAGECDSECRDKEEILRLKKEVERLLSENSALRKEIARFKDDEEAGCSGLSGQAFYAGGSERSGQQILGPSKGRKDIVSEVFKSVKERGAVVFEDEPSSSSRGRGGGTFGGVGYRLGQTADDHEQVSPAGAAQGAQEPEGRSVKLRLYREGFSVDQGPLRSYNDPEQAEFLNHIRRGEIPPELGGSGQVRVSLEDRRHEECPRSVQKQAAFTGKGHLLGSPTPPTVGATAPIASAATDREANQRAAQQAVSLDEQQPSTTVQFRLTDGSRITGRFNHTHTVADLHEYVLRAEPAYQMQTFTLLTTFPSKELSDPTATLAAANLLNTTLLQRLK